MEPEANTEGMSAWLDGLKWDAGGLVAVIAQVSFNLPLAYILVHAALPFVISTVDTDIDGDMLAV